MSGELLSFVLDMVILVCLGFTIYYALKLSKSLNAFRRYRAEFGKAIEELSGHIARAEDAIGNFKAKTSDAGRELQDMLDESRLLLDELQIINQSGEGLAKRLEGLADNSGRVLQSSGMVYDSDIFEQQSDVETSQEESEPFFIQDRDYDEGQDNESVEAGSDAERELLEALRKNKKASGGGLL